MSRTTLIECSPRLPDGTTVTLRLVDRSPRGAAYLGAQWLPHVEELPAFETAVGFDGDRFGAAPAPQIGALAFALAPEIRAAAGWVWRDAPVTIRQADWPIDGSNPADGAFAITFTATASAISVDDRGVARVELIDRGQALRVPAAPMRFGASGIALIDAAAAARDRQPGTVVPVAFGRVLNLPGLLVDRVNNIWLLAAQAQGGPAATSVEAIYEGGLAFTPGTARANLAALQATTPAAGTVDWCLNASGLLLARLADRPTYPITCDATFGSATLGHVFTAIIGGRLSIWPGEPAALDALGLGDCGLYIADEASVADALDRLCAGLGLCWKVRSDGLVRAFRLQWDTPVLRVASHQRHAPRRLRTILPAGRRQLGYATNNRVHGDGEIARILLADSLAYADGTLIEALKPAEAGADVTADAVPSLDALPGQVFQADHLGTISAGQLPRTVQATRRRGAEVVSGSTSWSVEATNCTASISAAGLVSITAVSGNGQVRVISTRDGVELRASFDVAVQRAAPPASGGGGTGTSASTSSLSGAPGGNVWTDITGDLVVTTGSAGEAGLGAALEFFPNITFPSTGFNLYDAELRWRRRTSPGVWEVVGAAATPNSSAQVETDLGNVIFQSNGTIVCNRTATGLGASASQTFRLQARAADAMFWFGGASATGN